MTSDIDYRVPHADDLLDAMAERAAERAIQKTFLAIGIDISTPNALLRTQDNFRFLDTLHESAQMVRRKTLLTVISVFVTGLLGFLFVAFSHRF